MKNTVLLIVGILLCCVFTAEIVHSAVYLHEGFNGSGLPPGWQQVRLAGTLASWSVVGQGSNPTITPYAGAGQAKFNSFDAAIGEQARLTSPAINLASSTDPFLALWMYHEDEYTSSFDSVYVEVATIDSINGPWTTVAGIRRPTTGNRWVKEVVSLYPYRTARVFVSLRGVSKFGNNIFVDEFRVADSSFHDIGTTALIFNSQQLAQGNSALEQFERTGSRMLTSSKHSSSSSLPEPIRISTSGPLNVSAIVRNYGTFTEGAYSIIWRINTQTQSPVLRAQQISARTGRDTVPLIWSNPIAGTHTISAWTLLSSDSTRTNDTARLTIQVIDTATVFYESFNGSAFPPAGWLTVNRDGGTLTPWFRGADTSTFVPFEGSGFAGNNFQRANSRYLDDYLISPQILSVGQNGKVDSLIFWVKSKFNSAPAQNFPDSLMVRLSTSGTDTSNFTIALDYFSVPKTEWVRKAYLLTGRVPTNSNIRVAFRYLLYDAGFSGTSGDFIGIDAVQVVRKLPAGLDDESVVPNRFTLEQNYPNPFNPTTEIRFQIPEPGQVTLKVFDVLGREVQTLVNEGLAPGSYARRFDAAELSSGVYFYRLHAKNFMTTKRMVLLR